AQGSAPCGPAPVQPGHRGGRVRAPRTGGFGGGKKPCRGHGPRPGAGGRGATAQLSRFIRGTAGVKAMKGLWKFLKWGLLAVVVLVVAVVFLVATLDPNDHKDWIASRVKEQTGRGVEFRGDLALTYYPWLGIEV